MCPCRAVPNRLRELRHEPGDPGHVVVLVEGLDVISFRPEAILAAVMAALILGLATWWHLSRVRAAEQAVHAHYTRVLADIQGKTAEAAAKFRATETVWQTRIEKEAQDGQARIDTARRDANAARDERDRMLIALNSYRAAARAAAHSGTAGAGQGEPGGEALDLLAGLLNRHTAELTAVGDFADELYARGTTCENSADTLSNSRRPAGGNSESNP